MAKVLEKDFTIDEPSSLKPEIAKAGLREIWTLHTDIAYRWEGKIAPLLLTDSTLFSSISQPILSFSVVEVRIKDSSFILIQSQLFIRVLF
jgi:hypothetical protein